MDQVVGCTGLSFTSFRTSLFRCSLHGFANFTDLSRAASRSKHPWPWNFKLRENLLVYFYIYECL